RPPRRACPAGTPVPRTCRLAGFSDAPARSRPGDFLLDGVAAELALQGLLLLHQIRHLAQLDDAAPATAVARAPLERALHALRDRLEDALRHHDARREREVRVAIDGERQALVLEAALLVRERALRVVVQGLGLLVVREVHVQRDRNPALHR